MTAPDSPMTNRLKPTPEQKHPIAMALLKALDIAPDAARRVTITSDAATGTEVAVVELAYWNPLISDLEHVVRTYAPVNPTERTA